jgi:hypothetical protein
MSIKKLLDDLDNGNVLQRIDEELARVTEGVEETHQPGKLTITFTISDEGMGRAKVDAKVEAKVPTHPLSASLFFFSKVPGNLSRDNERQGKLNYLPTPKAAESEDVDENGEVR